MITCSVPECDELATHRFVHKSCRYGSLICNDHAVILVQAWRVYGQTVVDGKARKCILCGERLMSTDDVDVTEIDSNAPRSWE